MKHEHNKQVLGEYRTHLSLFIELIKLMKGKALRKHSLHEKTCIKLYNNLKKKNAMK